MIDRSLRFRFRVVAALLISATLLLHFANGRTKLPIRRPLKEMPMILGDWRGADVPLTEHIVEAAGMDDYLNRVYSDAAGNGVEVYTGYYGSQRSGELIHSPKNCLPGAGWEWLRKGSLVVSVPNRPPIQVNDFRIGKGLQQALVLYWYEGRGRAVASEYTAKFWMIADALIRHRTDGSLVRIVIPIRHTEGEARAAGVRFIQVFLPRLSSFIPD